MWLTAPEKPGLLLAPQGPGSAASSGPTGRELLGGDPPTHTHTLAQLYWGADNNPL